MNMWHVMLSLYTYFAYMLANTTAFFFPILMGSTNAVTVYILETNEKKLKDPLY